MEEIFHKLCYEAMIRSKLVCKEWNSIISCQKFMDDHYNYRRLTEGNHLIVLSFNSKSWKSNFYTSSYSNFVKEQSLMSMTIPIENNPRTRNWSTRPWIVGSYNGLVALFCYDKFILWNPITTKYSSVSTVEYNTRIMSSRDLYGLCYDGSTDEYSVLVLSSYRNLHPERGYAHMSSFLYNFKDGRERRQCRDLFNKRLYDCRFYNGEIGKVIHGSPHWVGKFYDYTDWLAKTEIFYFDSKDEMFKHITHPGEYSGDKRLLGLAAIGDENQLGCVLPDIAGSSLEVWVMKEYGKSESWTNLFTIPYLNVTNKLGSISYMNVIGSMPTGELLLYLNGNELWIYDVETENSRKIKFQDKNFSSVITYMPKLISPPEPLKA